MRKFSFLFAFLLSMMGATQAWAETICYPVSTTNISAMSSQTALTSAGWEIDSDWNFYTGYGLYCHWSSNAPGSALNIVTPAQTIGESESFNFSFYKYNTSTTDHSLIVYASTSKTDWSNAQEVYNSSSKSVSGYQSEPTIVEIENLLAGTYYFKFVAQKICLQEIGVYHSILVNSEKTYQSFNSYSAPDTWQGTMTFSTSGAYNSSTTSDQSLTTPKLTFEENEVFTIDAQAYSYSDFSKATLKVDVSEDGNSWNEVPVLGGGLYENLKTYAVTINSANTHYVRITGKYITIKNVYGGEIIKEPKMEVSANDYNFGWVSSSSSTTFVIKNSGSAELTGITVSSDNTNITFSGVPSVLAAAESATVTVNITTPGFYNNDIIISASEQTPATFHVLGAVKEEEKILVDFEGGNMPEGWTTEGWTAYSTASGTDNNKGWAGPTDEGIEVRLISPKLTVVEGEPLFFCVFPRYNNSGSLKIEYRDNETDEWTVAKSFEYSDFASGKWSMISVTEIPAGTHYIAFNDQEIYLTDIYGFQLAQDEPATGMNIYMKANGWADDNARMLAWYWGEGNEGAWSDNLTAVEGEEDIYTVSLPEGTTGLKFVRKSQDSALGWGSENNWNESANNINVYDGAYYTMNGFSGFNGNDPLYGYYEQELTEAAENTDAINVGTHHNMTVSFTMQAGKFAAICLPFATTTTALGEGVKAWAFNGYDGNISLTTTNDLEAGKPYVVYAANGVNGFNFQNVTIASNEAGSVEQGAATFQGSYVKMVAGTMIGKYGVTPDGMIKKAGEGASMKAFRAYFEGITPNAKLACDGVIIGEATGIDTIENAELTGELYDLQGRRVNNAQKGIYIQNGKKFVVK